MDENSEVVARLAEATHQANLFEHSIPTMLYVDTADVRRALLGANEYMRRKPRERDAYMLDVDESAFQKPQVLIACLLAANMLNKFAMLPPHQTELVRQFQTQEVFNRFTTKPDEDRFLRSVGIDASWWSGEGLRKGQFEALLAAQAGERTQRFFKAVQCVRFHWWDQFNRLKRSRQLIAFPASIDYRPLIRSAELSRVVMAFHRLRGDESHEHRLSKNNFSDAMALLILVELTRQFRTGESPTVPRFYDPTGLFAQVAQEADLTDRLTIKVKDIDVPVFISTEALIIAASLNHDASAVRTAVDNLPSQEVIDGIDGLVKADGRPVLADQVRRFMDLSFLENVWLKTMAAEEVRELARRWISEKVLKERFRTDIKLTVAASEQDVLAGAQEYSRFGDAWPKLLPRVLALRQELRTHEPALTTSAGGDDLGVFRFCPSAQTLNGVKSCRDSLLDNSLSDDDVVSQTAWHDFVVACAELLNHPELPLPEDRHHGIDFAAATLWSLGLYAEVLHYLEEEAHARTTFLSTTIYAAAALRLGQEVQAAESIIRALRADFELLEQDATSLNAKSVVMAQASSLAYLCFHLWHSKLQGDAWWRCAADDEPAKKRRVRASPWLYDAIKLVDIAWRAADEVSEMPGAVLDVELRRRMLYIGNQRLYYLTELGDHRRLEDMQGAKTFLDAHTTVAEGLWRPTYWDTLGRYHGLMAFLADDADQWANYMTRAMKDVKQAKKGSNERVVQLYGDWLEETWLKGFRGARRVQDALPNA